MKILLTAPPQTGKSTVMSAVIKQLSGLSRGIIAREILDASGRRTGFKSVNSAGESRQFMFYTDAPTDESIAGQFDVDIEAVDNFVVPELQAGLNFPQALIYIDEIGRAQAKSSLFLETLQKLFQGKNNILAAIVYDDEPWARQFKKFPGSCTLEVSLDNREVLPLILTTALNHAASFAALSMVQQELAYTLWRRFIDSRQYIAAQKLFTNAVPYVLTNRLQLLRRQEDICEFSLPGNSREHHIRWNQKEHSFICDCDLSNARGSFALQAETCSHQMCVLLMHASCQSMS